MRILIFLILFNSISISAQGNYSISETNPFGLANPDAPEQIKDFEPMIGVSDCKSVNRNQDGRWQESVNMTWRFFYIMNGMAVQDETIKEDGLGAGSIRQFIADSSRWYVHWYSTGTPQFNLPTWEGNKKDDKIVLYRKQKAPSGMDGFYRLTFYDMSKTGYRWIGEWVDPNEQIVYPTWKIDCMKRKM